MRRQAESSLESSGENRRQAGLESAVMPVAPTEAPRLDERLQVPRGDADGVQNAHVREFAPGGQPVHARRANAKVRGHVAHG
jgi:hypothetical protein